MKKFKILIPVYNDWESLIKLLDEINKVVVAIKNAEFHCMVVNDASTIKPPNIKVPQNIKSLQTKWGKWFNLIAFLALSSIISFLDLWFLHSCSISAKFKHV